MVRQSIAELALWVALKLAAYDSPEKDAAAKRASQAPGCFAEICKARCAHVVPVAARQVYGGLSLVVETYLAFGSCDGVRSRICSLAYAAGVQRR